MACTSHTGLSAWLLFSFKKERKKGMGQVLLRRVPSVMVILVVLLVVP